MITDYLKKAFAENLGLKAFAFFIAIMTWGFIMSGKDTVLGIDVGIKVKLPAEKALVGNVPMKVVVNLTGPIRAISTFKEKDLTIVVDLTHSPLGHSVANIDPSSLSLPPGVRASGVNPAQIEIFIERKIRKEVDVIAKFEGMPEEGFKLLESGIRTDPAKITVEGGESELSLIEAVYTRPIDVTGRDASFKSSAEIILPSSRIKSIDGEEVAVFAAIGPDLLTREIVGVKVAAGRPEKEGYKADPSTVRVFVRGLRKYLDKLKIDDVKAYVAADDVLGAKDVKVDLPKGISLIRVVPPQAVLKKK